MPRNGRITGNVLAEWPDRVAPSSPTAGQPNTILDFDYTKAMGVWNMRSTMQFPRAPAGPVAEGLVLQLDAGQVASYPGSGATWTDLSGTNNGTLVNDVTYTSANGGGLIFGGSDDYVSLGTINTNLSNNTFMFQVSASVINQNNTFIAGAAGGYYQIRFNATNQVQLVHSTIVNMGTFTGFTASANTVYNIAVTRDGTTYTLYVDGEYVSQLTASATFTTTSPRLGINALLEELTGTMYCAYFYDRTLSAGEVLQNYQFINSRF